MGVPVTLLWRVFLSENSASSRLTLCLYSCIVGTEGKDCSAVAQLQPRVCYFADCGDLRKWGRKPGRLWVTFLSSQRGEIVE